MRYFVVCVILLTTPFSFGECRDQGSSPYCSQDSTTRYWRCETGPISKQSLDRADGMWTLYRSGTMDGRTVHLSKWCDVTAALLDSHEKEMKLLNRKAGTLGIPTITGGQVKLIIH